MAKAKVSEADLYRSPSVGLLAYYAAAALADGGEISGIRAISLAMGIPQAENAAYVRAHLIVDRGHAAIYKPKKGLLSLSLTGPGLEFVATHVSRIEGMVGQYRRMFPAMTATPAKRRKRA